MMRVGPKPLPFQLGMASLASAGLAGGTQFDDSVLQGFFTGIKKYQGHSFKRVMPDLPIVWQEGEAKLYRAPSQGRKYDIPVILIPSMVNKSDILDLLPDRSLLRWLAEQGFDSYLFDWGFAAADPYQDEFDTALAERLLPAIEKLNQPVLLLGYCMGGLFAAALSSLRPDLIKGTLLLATPWNFHDEKAYLKHRMTLMRPMAAPYMKQYGRLPDSWMQAVFASLDPEGSIRKFSSFAKMADDDRRAELFVSVEDWLNDGMDLPGGIARTCMEDWYEGNHPYKGTWEVLGQAVRAQEIKIPTLVVAARDDKIVTPESALAFADQRLKGDRLVCPTGHVGLLAGRKAITDIWKPMADWFAVQQ